MITQPYTQLVLGDAVFSEVSPATPIDAANAVQLTIEAVELSGGAGSTQVSIQVSNDAQNWTSQGSPFSVGLGFYVMPAVTGICTRYIRVACTLFDDVTVLLAVTQSTMRL